MSETKTEIINAMRDGITHYKEIAKKIGKTEGNVRKTLSIMKKDGQVMPIGGGHYQSTAVPIPENLKPGPAPNLQADDYIRSNEKALHLLVKIRGIVDKAMDEYGLGMRDFPAQEISSLEKLERTYKDQLQTKTEASQETKKDEFRKFIILPNNNRIPLTEEQCTDQKIYELLQLKKTDVMPNNNVIIENNDDQHCFPFYDL